MQWLNLWQIEWLKTKRTFVLLMLFICPLATALFPLAQHLHNDGAIIAVKGWNVYWQNAVLMWALLMMPMFCVLSSALLVQSEHANQTWRLMLTLPVSKVQVFVVKLLMAWSFVVIASALLLLFSLIGVGLLVLKGYPLTDAFEFPVLRTLGLLSVSCLPMVVFQHVISWRFSHLMAVLSVGLVTTLGISFVGRSEYWPYYPWDYPMLIVSGASEYSAQATMLSVLVGVICTAAASFWAGKREIFT